METKNNIKGKFIVAFDTIVDGWQSATDEKGNPVLFDSHDEAFKELFDDALSMLQNRSEEELAEYNEGVTPTMVKVMEKIYETGDVELMKIFLDTNPNCNDNNEFVVPAEEFKLGHKTIFTK